METNFNWLYAKVRKLKKENAKLKKALQKTELDKLQKYLDDANIKYERIDKVSTYMSGIETHQIIVKNKDGKVEWDAICQPGSEGYRSGLLEVAGIIVEDTFPYRIEGCVTADEVIKRIGKI